MQKVMFWSSLGYVLKLLGIYFTFWFLWDKWNEFVFVFLFVSFVNDFCFYTVCFTIESGCGGFTVKFYFFIIYGETNFKKDDNNLNSINLFSCLVPILNSTVSVLLGIIVLIVNLKLYILSRFV